MKKRKCIRFAILGATVRVKKKSFFFSPPGFEEGVYPVFDLSRGGLRFLANTRFKPNARLLIELSLPGETVPLQLHGKVRWVSLNPEQSYSCQIGAQFSPFGKKNGQNSRACLEKLVSLESNYVASAGRLGVTEINSSSGVAPGRCQDPVSI